MPDFKFGIGAGLSGVACTCCKLLMLEYIAGVFKEK